MQHLHYLRDWLHFLKSKLLFSQQGHRNAKSTITALVEYAEDILDAKDYQDSVAMILCDLSKTFDMVSHEL